MALSRARGNTYRSTVITGLALLAGGTSRTLETRVTSTTRWTCITTGTLGTIFARSARRARGAWVTLEEKHGV